MAERKAKRKRKYRKPFRELEPVVQIVLTAKPRPGPPKMSEQQLDRFMRGKR